MDDPCLAPGWTSLSGFPVVSPREAQVAIIQRAERRARELGLTLPAGVKFYLVDVPRDSTIHHGGETFCYGAGRVEVYFRADLMPDALYEVALHEYQHVADHERVATAWGFDWAWLERRAEDFVAKAMGWPR